MEEKVREEGEDYANATKRKMDHINFRNPNPVDWRTQRRPGSLLNTPSGRLIVQCQTLGNTVLEQQTRLAKMTCKKAQEWHVRKQTMGSVQSCVPYNVATVVPAYPRQSCNRDAKMHTNQLFLDLV